MTHALLTPRLASQPPGVGTRLVRRIGGVVRSALACLRRPVKPFSPAAKLTTTETPQAPAERRRASPGKTTVAAPAEPASRGWLARWFGHGEPPAAASWQLDFPDDLTPENHPGFTAEECASLNTPAAELPPEMLQGLLTALAPIMAEHLPPELGLGDPQALFAGLWSLLAAPPDEGAPDVTPAKPDDAISAIPMDAAPETPIPPPDSQSAAPAADVPDRATPSMPVEANATPETSVLAQPALHRRSRPPGRHRSFPGPRRDPSPAWHGARQQPPPRRRVYFACAGPP